MPIAFDNVGYELHVGDYVLRVRGTNIGELYGYVRDIREPLNPHNDPQLLVAIDGPGEPGIGHQFVCPGEHLRRIDRS